MFSVALIVVFIAGVWLGYIFSYFGMESARKEWAERDDAFLHRIEAIEYELPCEKLNNPGLSGPFESDDIIYYIDVREDVYHVIGFSTDEIGPLVSWSGGGRPACK